MATDPTERFSGRAASYVRGRPGYPREVLDFLREETGWAEPVVVADVGSGTGIFTRLLLDAGHTVHAVEPNAPMRREAEAALAGTPGFHSVEGRAEATDLADSSVDLVTAAQAFHWFDPEAAGAEWRRILRPPGWTLLVWNQRQSAGSPFLEAFEAFLREWGTDYREVRATWAAEESLTRLYGEGGWSERRIPNEQRLDRQALQERVLSSSYMPASGPRRAPMLAALERLFAEHEREGCVTMAYQTAVYLGALLR